MGAVSTKRGLPTWGRWLLRLSLALAVAILLSYLPYRLVGGQGDHKLAEMRTELTRVQREIAAGEVELVARRRLVQALKTDTRMIEDIARDELHMLYPHEKTLRLAPSAEAQP